MSAQHHPPRPGGRLTEHHDQMLRLLARLVVDDYLAEISDAREPAKSEASEPPLAPERERPE